MNNDEKLVINSLNGNREGPSFYKEVEAVKLPNEFIVAWTKDHSKAVTVLYKGKAVVNIDADDDMVVLFDQDNLYAPTWGSERLIINNEYITYKGSNYTIWDVGFDGSDIIFDRTLQTGSVNIMGKGCRLVMEFLACCETDGEYQIFGFDPKRADLWRPRRPDAQLPAEVVCGIDPSF